MSLFQRYLVTAALAACTCMLVFGTACTSCSTNSKTNEKNPPDLTLTVVDLGNLSNSIQKIAPMTVVPPGQPDNGVNPDPSGNENYNYLFEIIATDAGGVSSFGYSSLFNTGGPCSPDSDYAAGSYFNVPPQPSHTNPDGTVPEVLVNFINVTAKQENQIVCGGSFTGDVPGVYVVTATATNYSNKTRKATWYVNIGNVQSVPQSSVGN